MATREGEEFTKIAHRAYLAPKSSNHRGHFKIKTQQKEEYFSAFDGQLLGLNMLIQESKNPAYPPSILYVLKMQDNSIGRVDVYVSADSDRCCSLINQLLCVDTKKDCQIKVFSYTDYVGLSIGNIGLTTVLRKFPKIESDKNDKKNHNIYVGVPDVVKTPSKINVKGEQEYNYDNSARVLFYLEQVCKAYPKMFDGEIFEPQVLITDPRSPYALVVKKTNNYQNESNELHTLNSTELQQNVAQKSDLTKWLESKRNDLHDRIWNLVCSSLDEQEQIKPNIAGVLERQINSIFNLKGKTQYDCQEISIFYSQVFHECLHKKLPYLSLYPNTFQFNEKGLVVFNQPKLSNNTPSDDDDLPF